MILFENWSEIFRVIISTLLIYPFIIISVKLFGKRSTASLNSFDWIVTVAIGATVGSTILVKDVTVAESITAILMLFGLQYVVTILAVHFPTFSKLVRAQPRLLFSNGEFMEKALIQARITKTEVEASARAKGYNDLTEVGAVILEGNGNLNILPPGESKTGLIDEMQ